MTGAKTVLAMPRVNANDDSAVLVSWLKTPGEAVRRGELVAQVETSKAAVDVEANDDGFLCPVALAGTMIAVGEPIAWITETYDPEAVATQARAGAPAGRMPAERLVSHKARQILDDAGVAPSEIPGVGAIGTRQVQQFLVLRDGGSAPAEPELANRLQILENSVVLFGASDQGVVVLDALRAGGTFAPLCFIDNKPVVAEVEGYPVFRPSVLDALSRCGVKLAHICVGSPEPKLRLAAQLKERGFTLINVIHPRATIAQNARLGEGVYIGPGVVVGPLAEIGDYCQVNNNATIPHHVRLGTGVRISDGANIAGGVRIGERSYLGLGVTVNTGCHIGADVTVVSGTAILDKVPDGTVVRAPRIRR